MRPSRSGGLTDSKLAIFDAVDDRNVSSIGPDQDIEGLNFSATESLLFIVCQYFLLRAAINTTVFIMAIKNTIVFMTAAE